MATAVSVRAHTQDERCIPPNCDIRRQYSYTLTAAFHGCRTRVTRRIQRPSGHQTTRIMPSVSFDGRPTTSARLVWCLSPNTVCLRVCLHLCRSLALQTPPASNTTQTGSSEHQPTHTGSELLRGRVIGQRLWLSAGNPRAGTPLNSCGKAMHAGPAALSRSKAHVPR